MDSMLINAFKFYMRDSAARPAFYYAEGYNGRNAWPEKAHGIAREALARARRDVAFGAKARYPNPYPRIGHGNGVSWRPDQPGIAYVDKPESVGLRFVGHVVPEMRRGDVWDSRGNTGWHTDPYGDVFRDGTGLAWGEVYQLPGRKGETRFVAGYRFGGCDGGPTLDFGRIYVESRGDWELDVPNCDAAIDAARAADSMAEHAAEDEREYQTAWQAGSRWNDLAEVISDARKKALAILAERRKVKGSDASPVLCEVIRDKIRDLVESIAESRAEQRKLADGDAEDLYFWPGDQRLRDAFMEGAGLDKFPA